MSGDITFFVAGDSVENRVRVIGTGYPGDRSTAISQGLYFNFGDKTVE